MTAIDLRSLASRLHDVARRGLEAAAGSAMSRSHYDVEIEHWLLHLFDTTRSDAVLLLQRSEMDRDRILAGLGRALDQMRTGNGNRPGLAPELVLIMKDAWLIASAEQGQQVIRSGHLLAAILSDEAVSRRLFSAVPALCGLSGDTLRRNFDQLLDDSVERPGSAQGEAGMGTASARAQPALDRYTVDLTAHARDSRIDPVLGRDNEIRQVIDILTRRRQNNPILTGEAGVGKTAVVEGLALRIAAGDVPPPLRRVSIRTLDLGLLQAGAGVKGEFENRLRGVLDEAQNSADPVILFVDEAHTLIGAGGAPGQGDAANLLKPPLARGELRVVAATTWGEYKKYIEKDPALARRFQAVKVEEPSVPAAIDMVRGLVPTLEAHHGVRILDEAVQAAVRLSIRFIQGRQLPDKAVSLIDTACARVGMSQAATPPAIEDRQRRLQAIATECRTLEREAISGAAHDERLLALRDEAATVQAELEALAARWEKEKDAATELRSLREAAEQAADPAPHRSALLASMERLRILGGEQPLVFPVVDVEAVAAIVESWTGIPTRRMRADAVAAVINLRDTLGRRVIGQDYALDAVSRAVRTSRAGLTDPRKPVGVFLMVGTSGVGKTETALALADALYGGEQNLTVINMSEFKEEHKVSLLMGAPPGYVGYGEGGVLTEAVRRRPHSVLLLDEIEKAHSGVQDVFFQVFDKGTMKDGEGRDVDFRNTVIIMASNAGTAAIEALFADPETVPDAAGLESALRAEMAKHFKPAFLGRVTLVPYLPLDRGTLERIVSLQIEKVRRRVKEQFGATVIVDNVFQESVAMLGNHSPSGARAIESFLSQRILPDLALELLSRTNQQRAISTIKIGMTAAEPSYVFS